MKHIFLFYLVLLSAAGSAQPTLTAATNNPVAGDDFTLYVCDDTGMTPGAAGAGVTWDFHTISVHEEVSLDFVGCAGTPYCDSFPASNISGIMYSGTTSYTYYQSDINKWEELGYFADVGCYYYYKPGNLLKYPAVYNSSFLDTTVSASSGAINYIITYDSTIVDGSGALILPSGTFTDVLRTHSIVIEYDSIAGGSPTFVDSFDAYSWFAPGFHYILMNITMVHTPGTSTIYDDAYYSTAVTEGVAPVYTNEPPLQVSPNPASDVLSIKFTCEDKENTAVTLSDITGKMVRSIGVAAISNGVADIQYSVADLPAGVYLVHLTDGAGSITKKVAVVH